MDKETMANGRQELSMDDADQLNQVTGGFAVDGGDGMYYAVDDKDGYILTSCNINIQYAQWPAGMNGQSKEIISKEEYQRWFGKPFSPNN